jgi:hypothetical protein
VEFDIYRLFQMLGRPQIDVPSDNMWERMALAQHHGLPTRLLDWTFNPLVAAFFSVESDPSFDGAVYSFEPTTILVPRDEPNPFSIKEQKVYLAEHLNPRITAQSGLFTAQPEPKTPFRTDDLDKVILEQKMKTKMQEILSIYGVHRGSLFPDLDGQAKYIEWMKTHKDLGGVS